MLSCCQACDAFGNTIHSSVGAVRAALAGDDQVKCVVSDRHNGTYSVSFVPCVAGVAKLQLLLGDAVIGGGPVPVSVVAGTSAL